jgi:hypothetical protein
MQPKRTRECVRTDAFLMHIWSTFASGWTPRTDAADVLRLAAGARFLSAQTQTDKNVRLRRPTEMPSHTKCLRKDNPNSFFFVNESNLC